MRTGLYGAATVTALLGAALLHGPALLAQEPAAPHPEIEHVVVIIEQSHTFDSYFAGYPGAGGYLTEGLAPRLPDGSGGTVGPTIYNAEGLTLRAIPEGVDFLSNGSVAANEAANSGAMDGFIVAQTVRDRQADLVMAYHTGETAPLLWELARNSVLFDNYFSAEMGGSLPNTLTLISGSAQGFAVESKNSLARLGAADFPTLFDALEERQLSWKFYIGRLAETSGQAVLSGTYQREDVATPPATYWAPVLAMPRFWTDPDLNAGLADQPQFYADVAAGKLPQVSFVVPLPTDHVLTSPSTGHSRLVSLINALMKGETWDSTAVFVVWDDWGGRYDHVLPPDGRGFRVPAMLISPWAKEGHVSHVIHDHRSVYDFVVEQFGLGLPPAGGTPGFDDAFDFTSGPRETSLYASDVLPPTPVGTSTQNRLTLGSYLLAMGLAVGVVVAAGVVGFLNRRNTRFGAWAFVRRSDQHP
jgi:phospholipase C